MLLHGEMLIKHRDNFTFLPSQITRLKLRILRTIFSRGIHIPIFYCPEETIRSKLHTFRVSITLSGFTPPQRIALMSLSQMCQGKYRDGR
jgi:hypothetical protein